MAWYTQLVQFLFPHPLHHQSLLCLSPERLLETCARMPQQPFPDTFVAFPYHDPYVRDCIWALKYHRTPKLGITLGIATGQSFLEELSDMQAFGLLRNPLLIPIPLNRRRLQERGYNQSELIAQGIAYALKLPLSSLHTDILIRPRYTLSQARQDSRQQRLANVKHVFSVAQARSLFEREVILVDDVITTGATVLEAKKLLLSHGARYVFIVAVAH